jgi:hypothetical protein
VSGILNVMLAGKRDTPLVLTSYSLTAGNPFQPGGGVTADLKYWGYSGTYSFGVLGPTTNGSYTVAEVYEVLTYSSNNGTYTTPTLREVYLKLTSGPAALKQSDLLRLGCAGGQQLLSGSASFSASGDGGQWVWTVTTGSDGSSYMGNGTVSIVP